MMGALTRGYKNVAKGAEEWEGPRQESECNKMACRSVYASMVNTIAFVVMASRIDSERTLV